MKFNKLNLTSQALVLGMATLTMGVLLQAAQAQTPSNPDIGLGQVLQTNMPQKTWGSKLRQNTTLSYYTQFLGPTLGGAGGQSYNVFQEGNTPYQNFHAANVRYQINTDWAFGASIAGVTAYGETVTSQQNGQFKGSQSRMVREELFNARAFLAIPSLVMRPGTLFTTVAYEAPTSTVARADDMKYGFVLTQNFAFKMPNVKWTSGLNWQYYRAFYNEEVVPPRNGNLSFARQTVIFNGGPYLGYRFNDKWGMNSSVIFDWDQRGLQTSTGSFNNNLPDRARLGVAYYPQKIKQIANVGLFTQGLLNYSRESHIVGAELAARF